ncbi:putative nucleoside-diphosphate-sugar epimerase [Aspergillus steynii IBT 23096]|uniref:Putative nucleoside-diphosphate-sugar epimerase n=1 Tax=Aspergillus steynii IBT 23096 TaxID=1392250 RepID=A0A2I2G4A1_9EURO|nr:putative nucleoside-diphosphate-sugar epimerase [Aspergillus steynii IBT 23096]PLB47689.1 putative nucleoside-diphosphate-sugar epimerase [Aspergillus steynii IBT 23096]
MAPKIFVTGATGLIGGDFLVVATTKHPDWEISVLVRDIEKCKIINTHFPGVRVVHASLEDLGVLERESREADVVLNFANCDHLPAAEAIIRGLSQREYVGTVIHTSGAKIIAWEMESQPSTWGKYMPRRYNDMEGVEELTRGPSDSNPEPTGYDHVLPNWAAHRDVDLAIMDGFRKHNNIQTAIVCPPTVYGPSRFPGFTRSIQIPRLLNVVLQVRRAFTINGNQNRWNMIHTQDISEMYVLLAEAAVDQRREGLWNEEGYYFAEKGEFVWGDVIKQIATLGYQKGLLVSGEPVELQNDLVHLFWGGGQVNMSSTSLGEARRARKLLGWNPVRDDFMADLDRVMDVEAELIKGRLLS